MSKTCLLRMLRATLVLLALLLPISLGAQNVTMEVKDVTVQQAVTLLQSQGNYTFRCPCSDFCRSESGLHGKG